MARVKGAMMTRKRRNATLKLAKGYWGSKSKHFKMAKQAVMKSGNYAYVGRKLKKRDYRRLWITRISAAVNTEGVIFSNIHVFSTISNTIANTRSRMKPIETLAKASLGESI